MRARARSGEERCRPCASRRPRGAPAGTPTAARRATRAHFDPVAARAAKRALFLETMSRIGRLAPELFRELPSKPSPAAYRLRSRFHASGRGDAAALGGYAPRTHRVEPLEACEALTDEMRASLPRLADALRSSGVLASEVATLSRIARRLPAPRAVPRSPEEGPVAKPARSVAPRFDGVRIEDSAGRVLHRSGEPRLWLAIAGPASFRRRRTRSSRRNRFLVEPLSEFVRAAAGEARARRRARRLRRSRTLRGGAPRCRPSG